MQKFKINFFRYSLDSILVNWPAKISIEISTQINSFSNAILKNPNILEINLVILFKGSAAAAVALEMTRQK